MVVAFASGHAASNGSIPSGVVVALHHPSRSVGSLLLVKKLPGEARDEVGNSRDRRGHPLGGQTKPSMYARTALVSPEAAAQMPNGWIS